MYNRLNKKGMGTVEVVIILAVLVGIALIFREAITDFIQKIIDGTLNDETIIERLRIN
ncbi:MAG TPA: Flp1 family type IVb pilin [Clostridia bacterium]|nr:Flp1 family type IVb pilin [Clostridia bacterium]HPJ77114.1 Flp1 family type IVb pilin [Clostridia bacterium]HXK71369.1 Flp1 family type IVb pilin [Clostridia bacterium]